MTYPSSAQIPSRSALALNQERTRLIQLSTSISCSAHELAVTADTFSGRLRGAPPGLNDKDQTQAHLAQAHLGQVRRNCDDAQCLAESTVDVLNGAALSWLIIQAVDETLRDAQARLTLGDFAYDRACDAA